MALVGRPNVGKSSLFNRVLGRREAIVLDRPGVTRDRIERIVRLEKYSVTLVDTGGLVPDAPDELLREVSRQARVAIEQADVVVLVLDARQGTTSLDDALAAELRPAAGRVLIAMNKCDTQGTAALGHEGWRLGLGEPIAVSAEHAIGIDNLIEAIEARLAENGVPVQPTIDADDTERLPDPGAQLQIAIVGRPNVGKSSLINFLVGKPRVSVSAEPGTTRDAIDVPLTRNGRRFMLVDTAGMRRQAKASGQDEAVGILMTRRRLRRSHVAIQLIDASVGLTSGDVAIAGEIQSAARPMILGLNKWDLVEDPTRRTAELENQIATRLRFLPPDLRRITLSSQTGQRSFKLIDMAAELADLAGRKIGTPELNRFLSSATARFISEGGKLSKLLYITQTGTSPPKFTIFCRHVARVSDSDKRFLENQLRSAFGLGPVPVLVELRESPRR